MKLTKSQRIVQALKQLQQFMPSASTGENNALHVLTGAFVSAYGELEFENEDLITIQFPGGSTHEIIGTLYLSLQILESAAHELHEGAGGKSPISVRASELSELFWQKYELD